jgi:hypothetical protein
LCCAGENLPSAQGRFATPSVRDCRLDPVPDRIRRVCGFAALGGVAAFLLLAATMAATGVDPDVLTDLRFHWAPLARRDRGSARRRRVGLAPCPGANVASIVAWACSARRGRAALRGVPAPGGRVGARHPHAARPDCLSPPAGAPSRCSEKPGLRLSTPSRCLVRAAAVGRFVTNVTKRGRDRHDPRSRSSSERGWS